MFLIKVNHSHLRIYGRLNLFFTNPLRRIKRTGKEDIIILNFSLMKLRNRYNLVSEFLKNTSPHNKIWTKLKEIFQGILKQDTDLKCV